LSVDRLDRVIAAIEGGMSCRQAAARFGVSAASAIRWRSRVRRQGDVRPGPLGGDRRSGRIEGHADLILGLVERKSDITLAELKKVGARGRAEPPRRPEPPSGLVRRPARPRSRTAGVHR